jgi:hypothetical protein
MCFSCLGLDVVSPEHKNSETICSGSSCHFAVHHFHPTELAFFGHTHRTKLLVDIIPWLTFPGTRPGKRTKNELENHHFIWENILKGDFP